MSTRLRTSVAAALLALLLTPVRAQHPDCSPTITVEGLVAAPRTYDLEALRRLPQTEVWIQSVTDMLPRSYRGVSLIELLMDAEPTFAPDGSTNALNWYVVVRATDERSAVIAWGEIHPSYEDKPVVVAYERDGALLPAAMGMGRLVVPFDRQGARGIANIRTISLRSADAGAPAGPPPLAARDGSPTAPRSATC